MEKTYDASRYEAKISQLWQQVNAFVSAGDTKKKPFSIIMPPPNANGSLHAGHLMYVVEDIATRYHRMLGEPTLWLPGTDHAGIETQVVYERKLEKRGKSRFDLGQKKFYAEVMDFTRSHQDTMITQMQSMGFSADWDKLKFTLDDDIIEIVYDTFMRLHDDGHIYRGNRIVNWCPRCQAAFADIELDHVEREDAMYTLDYGPLQIATTRPETIFADVAVAVNPNDERYKKLLGQEAVIPLVGRAIPIIADEHVDPTAGTGVLKVTPAHDFNDYEIGQRHNLPEISVIDPDGKLINVPERYAGLDTATARQKVVADLESAGALIKATPLTHAVAIHDRCKSVIEPILSEQWFLRVHELNQPVIEAIKSGKIKFHPPRFRKIALDWLAQEHDWCISRQIWWGIRIPVYYKTSHDPKKDPYIIARDEAEAQKYYGEGNYRAETDTFDTWFSSSQWPYATLQTTGDFEQFYPTSIMATARDILHKWVTRMIMFGLYATGKIPFENVYLWGMVTDEHKQKLSKSKGNYDDPMKITAEYGTDALRLALSIGITPGNDGAISEAKIRGYRNFVNKLWNIARYAQAQFETDGSNDAKETATKSNNEVSKTDKINLAAKKARPAADFSANSNPVPRSSADHWILSRLSHATKTISKDLDALRFSNAGDTLYHFVWDDLADRYIEASKSQPNSPLLAYTLSVCLKLAHPFAPFVTEAIWQELGFSKNLLITEQWPNSIVSFDSNAGKTFEIEIKEILAQKSAQVNQHKKAAIKRDLTAKQNMLKLAQNKLNNKSFVEKAPLEIKIQEEIRVKEALEAIKRLETELEAGNATE